MLSLTWHHVQSPGLEADSAGETKVSKQHSPGLWRAKWRTHTLTDHIVRKIAFHANSISKCYWALTCEREASTLPQLPLGPEKEEPPLRHLSIIHPRVLLRDSAGIIYTGNHFNTLNLYKFLARFTVSQGFYALNAWAQIESDWGRSTTRWQHLVIFYKSTEDSSCFCFLNSSLCGP